MKIALITFPKDVKYPLSNPHHWWTPPEYVLEYWTGMCKIQFIDDVDYEMKKADVHYILKELMNTLSEVVYQSSTILHCDESDLSIDIHKHSTITIQKKK